MQSLQEQIYTHLNTLERVLSSKERELEELRIKCDKLQTENSFLKAEVANSTDAGKRASDQEYVSKLQSYFKTSLEASSQCSQLRQQLSQLQESNSELQEKLHDIQETLRNHEQQASLKLAEVEQMYEARIKSLEAEIECERSKFKEELKRIQDELLQLQAKLKQTTQSHEIELDKLRFELADKTQQLVEKESELAEAKRQRIEAIKEADLKLQRVRMKYEEHLLQLSQHPDGQYQALLDALKDGYEQELKLLRSQLHAMPK